MALRYQQYPGTRDELVSLRLRRRMLEQCGRLDLATALEGKVAGKSDEEVALQASRAYASRTQTTGGMSSQQDPALRRATN